MILTKDNRKNTSTHRTRIIRIALAAILIEFYIILVNVLLSAALIPSFMDRLEAADRITEQSYNELVQTSALEQQVDETISQTQQWYREVRVEKPEKTSEDGYHLVAAEFYPSLELSESLWDAQQLPALPSKEELPDTYERNAHTWVLLLHGYTGRKEELYPFAYWYNIQGCHVIVPDMRCQGESEGDFIGMGCTDSQDNMLWIREILEQDPDAEIIIHGQSMGAACALILSGRDDLPENVKAIISDCAYTDAYTMFADRLQAWFHLPPFTVIPAANQMLQLRGGYNLKDADALEAVQKNEIPTLFIHGDLDQMIPVEMAKELYEAKKGEKELLIIQGAGHAQAPDIDPDRYWQAVRKIME